MVQLCGGVSDLQNNIYSSEIAKNFSKAWGAKAFAPVCPALVDSRQLKEMFLSETNVSKVMELAYDANVALITMDLTDSRMRSAVQGISVRKRCSA